MKKLTYIATFLALGLGGASAAFAGREPPVPIRTVAPDYPQEMRSRGVSAIVMVKCAIDAQGNVDETIVSKSSNENFDNSALAAVKKWKFKPAREDGNPVAMTVTIPIKFVADEN
ncbi:MAG TPA: energy transducer TonB [Opitutus sp.]|nr:energy transducer TonB [Opitutus sp.]